MFPLPPPLTHSMVITYFQPWVKPFLHWNHPSLVCAFLPARVTNSRSGGSWRFKSRAWRGWDLWGREIGFQWSVILQTPPFKAAFSSGKLLSVIWRWVIILGDFQVPPRGWQSYYQPGFHIQDQNHQGWIGPVIYSQNTVRTTRASWFGPSQQQQWQV